MNPDLEKAVTKQITDAIMSYDFKTHIHRIISGVVTNIIENFFRHGECKDLIEQCTSDALKNLDPNGDDG